MDIAEFLKRFLWVDGRSSRVEWWLVHIGCMIAFAINDALFLDLRGPGFAGARVFQIPMSWMLIDALLLWMSVTSIIRRLHDRNKSGWWGLVYLVPFFGWLWFVIECGFMHGRPAPADMRAAQAPTGPVQRTAVQRMPPKAWQARRVATFAAKAIGFTLLSLVIYVWVISAGPRPVRHGLQPQGPEEHRAPR